MKSKLDGNKQLWRRPNPLKKRFKTHSGVFQDFSEPWHPRFGTGLMKRLAKFLSSNDPQYEFKTQQMATDLLRKTYCQLQSKFGYSDDQYTGKGS